MTTKETKGEDDRLQNLHTQQRQALNDAYAQLESEKVVQTFNSFSFEEALQNQIELIEGESTKIRPNELDRVDRVYFNLKQAVAEVKKVPPEQFLTPDKATDVNSPPGDEDTVESNVDAALARRSQQDRQ